MTGLCKSQKVMHKKQQNSK